MPSASPALPSLRLLESQARWLAPVRSGLLRRASIAQRKVVLDLGAGRGVVTPELIRRGAGFVYALDLDLLSLCEVETAPSLLRIAGDAEHLPFARMSVDLVFCQFTLLWLADLAAVISGLWRVLKPGGQLCIIEPDYLALIEYPPAIAVVNVWRAALSRSGAHCDVGRRLPGMLQRQGFKVNVRLLDQLLPPSPLRFDMLRELPLTPEESATVAAAQDAAAVLDGWRQIGHLPLFIINASRPE